MDSNDQKLSCFFMFVYEWIVCMISVCSITRLSNLFTQVHIHDLTIAGRLRKDLKNTQKYGMKDKTFFSFQGGWSLTNFSHI
jgi:hypothetical protein